MKLIAGKGVLCDDGSIEEILVFILTDMEDNHLAIKYIFNEYGQELRPDDNFLSGIAIRHSIMGGLKLLDEEAIFLYSLPSVEPQYAMLVDSNENRMQLSVVLLKYGDLVSKGYRVYNDNIGYNAIYSPWGTFIEDTSGFKVYEVFDSGAKESTKLVHLMSLSDKLMVEQGDFSYGNSKEI